MPITEQFLYQTDKSSCRRCSVKKLFVKTLQRSQENTCVKSLLIKVTGRKPVRLAPLLKRDSNTDVFL